MLEKISTTTGGRFSPNYPTGRPVVPRDNAPPLPILWLQTLVVVPKMVRNLLEAFAEFHFEVPISRYRLFALSYALINDPELIRHVFVERADVLEADPLRQKILRPVLRDGMLTAEGEVWRRSRRIIAPVFSPRHVNGFAKTMQKTSVEFTNELVEGPAEISVGDAMARMTYLILSETLFSGEISGNSDAFLADIAHFLKYMSNPDPFDLMSVPDWVPRLSKLRGAGAIKRMRAAVRETAAQRQIAITAGEQVPQDFLTLLLKAQDDDDSRLTPDEIEDNIITFIAAGHETTARALAWTLYLLSKDHAARERVEKEVDALDMDAVPPEEWGKHLPWLTACFEEAMRLFPPAAMILRRLKEDINFKENEIPAGTTVLVSPWVLHRHELLWDEPAAFKPDRFFGENREKIGRFSYLPFGAGPRVCIGASFAIMELQIALATLLRRLRFDYVDDSEPWPVMKITIQPDNGMPMTISPR